jgi:hypothetical protein
MGRSFCRDLIDLLLAIMEATSVPFRACCLTIGILIGGASGCCRPIVLSGRFDDARVMDPTCAALGDDAVGDSAAWDREGVVRGHGLPAMQLPAVAWPHCLTRAGFRQGCDDFRNNYLQPEAPPLKPPHSRFHPLPTQPAFAPRAEYPAPQLVGHPHAPAHPAALPSPEELPLPIPVPSAEPNLRDAPRRKVEEDAAPVLIPSPSAPALPVPRVLDESRGSISPTSFQQAEPNPLRKGSLSFR